jgi:2-polyprenyl-3-methyl-5-hydroxy-6-metoxy-1,4-benzoquinol methylase
MCASLRAKAETSGWNNVQAVCADVVLVSRQQNTAGQEAVAALQAAGPFDLIVAVTVLGFVEDRAGTLRALGALLAPDGVICHMDWPNSKAGSASKARALYRAAALEEVHSGRTKVKGWALYVGVARRAKDGEKQ